MKRAYLPPEHKNQSKETLNESVNLNMEVARILTEERERLMRENQPAPITKAHVDYFCEFLSGLPYDYQPAEFRTYSLTLKLLERKQNIADYLTFRESVRVPDASVVRLWRQHRARNIAKRVQEIIEAKINVADFLAHGNTLVADTKEEIQKLLPSEREIQQWEAQNSKDFIHALNEVVRQ